MVVSRRNDQVGVKAQGMGDFSRGKLPRPKRDDPKPLKTKPCGWSLEELRSLIEHTKTMSLDDAILAVKGPPPD